MNLQSTLAGCKIFDRRPWLEYRASRSNYTSAWYVYLCGPKYSSLCDSEQINLGVFGSGKRFDSGPSNAGSFSSNICIFSYLAAVIIIFIRDVIETANLHREPDELIDFKIMISSMTVCNAKFMEG